MNHKTCNTNYAKKLSKFSWLGFLLALTISGAASAGQSPVKDIAASTFIESECMVSGATGIPFGSYAAAGAKYAAATITIRCTTGALNGASLKVWMGCGLNSTGSCLRRMSAAGGQYLSYDVYKDSGYASPWNSASPVIQTNDGGGSISYTAYGRILAGQGTAKAGSYSDTINVSLSF